MATYFLISVDLGSRSSFLVSTHVDADNKLRKRTIFDARPKKDVDKIPQQKLSFEAHPTHEYQAKSYVAIKPG